MKRVLVAASVCAIAVGCAHEEPAHQSIIVHPTPVVLDAHLAGASPTTTIIAAEPRSRRDPSRIQVLPAKRPDRPAEVLGVVDAHLPMGHHGRAIDLLREKAAELGADAIIGVDFNHGEGHGTEPTHLSGLAIRYLDRPLSAD